MNPIVPLIVIMTVALTGCITKPVPVTPTPVQMPALPSSLNQRAEPLPPATATDLHGLIRESMATDRAYNEVRDRLNTVLDVYDCVRTAMNTGSDAKACFREAGQ